MASTDELFRQGMALFQAGNLPAAEAAFRKLARRERRNPLVLGVFGAILVALAKFEEAERTLREAVRLDPASHPALYNHGLALKALGRPEAALARFTEALAINPADAETWINSGAVRNDLKDHAGAAADFDRALAINPRDARAHFNKGNALASLGRHDDALAAYRAALAAAPRFVEGWIALGNTFHKLGRHAEAADAFREARAIAPHYPFVKGLVLHQQMLICDWRGVDALTAEIEADLAAGRPAAEPFGWQGVATSNRSLQRCAELYNALKCPAAVAKPAAPAPRDGAIRIGYVSGEFREQATALLMAGVFEHHDRARFEIHAFDNGWDDGGELRRRIVAAVHRLTPIRALADAQADAAIREAGIDILVNLNGYFGEDRTALFARRPAPVQVNYLGFPGTLGAPYIDYIVADRIVIPPDERGFFTEKVVTLPDCYQANDRARALPGPAPTRESCGLPADGFVFCCFNNTYKIVPALFARWMRILAAVPGSVLWLMADHADAAANLRRQAAAHGIAPERLVFAPRAPLPDHLARHACADLFLDTLPYNAHTTASDALWAGLPLLTSAGTTFAGRVAASLLTHAGLPDLVASSPDDYERRAVALAADPQALAALRARLAAGRLTVPLFDTARFTRQLERAYEAMHARRRARLAPDHLEIAADGRGPAQA